MNIIQLSWTYTSTIIYIFLMKITTMLIFSLQSGWKCLKNLILKKTQISSRIKALRSTPQNARKMSWTRWLTLIPINQNLNLKMLSLRSTKVTECIPLRYRTYRCSWAVNYPPKYWSPLPILLVIKVVQQQQRGVYPLEFRQPN